MKKILAFVLLLTLLLINTITVTAFSPSDKVIWNYDSGVNEEMVVDIFYQESYQQEILELSQSGSFNLLSSKSLEDVYIGKLHHFIEFHIDASNIETSLYMIINIASEVDFIEHVSVYNYEEYLAETFDFDDGGAGGGGDPGPGPVGHICGLYEDIQPSDSIYENNTIYQGANLKIGILENAYVDNFCGEFENTSIVYKDLDQTNYGLHVSQVASIMVGDKGIASDATLYNAVLDGTTVAKLDEAFDWFNSNNVPVVNMSLGSVSGLYSSQDWFLDYIAQETGILIVNAAGNDGLNRVLAKPSLGYNRITVGNFDSNGSISVNSSYVDFVGDDAPIGGISEDEPNIEKPDLVAIGHYDFWDPILDETDTSDGTSYSAPAVSALALLLMEKNPGLLFNPKGVQAVLSVNADRFDLINQGVTFNSYGLSATAGAGFVDLYDSISNVNNYSWGNINKQEHYGKTNYVVASKNIYPGANLGVTIYLGWERPLVYNSYKWDLLDLNIYVSNHTTGQVICFTSNSHSNYEFLYCPLSQYGIYTIEIKMEEYYNNNYSSISIDYAYSYRY